MFKKTTYLVIFLALLVTCTGLAVAADVNDTTDDATTITADTTTSLSDVQEQAIASESNKITKNTKNIKTDDEYIGVTVNQTNFYNYFDNETGYTKNTVSNNSNLRFDGTINVEQNITIDKSLNITAINNGKIYLNTIAGSLMGDDPGNSFTVNFNGSNTNITGLKFYNTQIFVKGAENVTLNEIDVEVVDQTVGSGVGVTSIREGAFNITVANSTFSTTNNGGSSTLVLANAQNCTIENNVLTAEGNVGNLIYLTTYNIPTGLTIDDINSYNVIRNNTVNGPSTSTAICWGIVLTGHNNIIEDNTINYVGTAITTQAINIIDENNYQNQISVNNTFNNNVINNGGNFICYENNTIENNTINGKITLYSKATARYNQINGNAIINGYNNFTQNNVTGTTSISGSYSNITYNKLLGQVTIKRTARNNNVTNNDITTTINNIGGTSNTITPNNLITPTNSLQNNKSNLKKDTSNPIIITKNNYADYFDEEYDEDGKSFCLFYYGSDGYFYFNDTINSKLRGIALYGDNNKVTANPEIKFTNVALLSFSGENNLFANMSVRFLTTMIPSENAGGNALFVQETDNGYTTFDNITVDYNVPTLTSAYEDFYPIGIIELKSNGTIKNCNIKINTVSTTVDWETGSEYYGFNKVLPINIIADLTDIPHQANITNNNITINADHTRGDYPTTYGINIKAPFNNSRVIGNNITMHAGEGWTYAVHPQSRGNLIEGNIINVTGINYTAGVGMENPKDNIVNNNTIIVNSSMEEHLYDGKSNEYCAYAIFINDYSYQGGNLNTNCNAYNNTISNNHIIGNAYNTYAFEQFGGKDTLIINNTLEIPNSNTGMAIGAIANNMSIINNSIYINATNVTGKTVDYLGAMTTGVFLARGGNSTITGNIINSTKYGMYLFSEDNDLIENNTVITQFDNSIRLRTVNNTIVTDNYLESLELKGDAAVINENGSDNTIENNLPGAVKEKTFIIYEPDDEYDNTEDIRIQGEIVYGDDEEALVGEDITITLTFSDETQKTYTVTTTDEGFDYTIPASDLIPGEATLTIEYAGNEIYNQTSQTFTITINDAQPPKEYFIKVDTTEFTIGTNATIKASIYLGNEYTSELAENINKGKVAFKVNGKTLKDANGKVIYAKVVNGIAIIENYLVPESWDKDGITMEAVYSGSADCDALRSEKQELTITNEITPAITTEDITATAGSKVTLKATVTGPAEMLNNAKVVFKINGKSVKDENGKVIYAKVVNGEVSVEYTIPENYKAKDYTLTATYISSNYDRIEDTKTLTIN